MTTKLIENVLNGHLSIEVEKLLCEKLGKAWSPNCSIFSLINELAHKPPVLDAEAKLKLAREALEIVINYQREACQIFHDTPEGFSLGELERHDEHLKFLEQALEKIGE